MYRITLTLLSILYIYSLAACNVSSAQPMINSPAILPTQTTITTPVDTNAAEFQRQLQKSIPAMLVRYKTPGAAIGLVRFGQVAWVDGYGVENLENGTPVTSHTIFRVASISKPVTAWGVMRLVEQGKIDLQGPVENYLTRWRFPPSQFDSHEVTIYRLLSHTAGTNIHGYGRGWIDGPKPTLEQSLTGEVYHSAGVQIIQRPGAGYLYSGGGYTVLQLMIEEVSGQIFENYMENAILNPLGMTESSFRPSPEILSRMATAYDENLEPVRQREFTEQAAAGLYATGRDLARFLCAGLPDPTGKKAGRGILKPETVDLMYKSASESNGQYGFGYQTYFDSVWFIYHGGDNPGWESTFTIIPSLGEGILSLTNSDSGEDFNAEITNTWVMWLAKVYNEGKE